MWPSGSGGDPDVFPGRRYTKLGYAGHGLVVRDLQAGGLEIAEAVARALARDAGTVQVTAGQSGNGRWGRYIGTGHAVSSHPRRARRSSARRYLGGSSFFCLCPDAPDDIVDGLDLSISASD